MTQHPTLPVLPVILPYHLHSRTLPHTHRRQTLSFVDPNTGVLTGTPISQYVFAVCASEYDSNGVLLSTLSRDYQLT